MENYKNFIQAINEKVIVNVTFNSKEKGIISRNCIPFDYGPSRRKGASNEDFYHLFDLEGADKNHNLSISPIQVISISLTDDLFNPSDYITWTPNWFVKRDWGVYS